MGMLEKQQEVDLQKFVKILQKKIGRNGQIWKQTVHSEMIKAHEEKEMVWCETYDIGKILENNNYILDSPRGCGFFQFNMQSLSTEPEPAIVLKYMKTVHPIIKEFNLSFKLTSKCCFVCQINFQREADFRSHVKIHGDEFTIPKDGFKSIDRQFTLSYCLQVDGLRKFELINSGGMSVIVKRIVVVCVPLEHDTIMFCEKELESGKTLDFGIYNTSMNRAHHNAVIIHFMKDSCSFFEQHNLMPKLDCSLLRHMVLPKMKLHHVTEDIKNIVKSGFKKDDGGVLSFLRQIESRGEYDKLTADIYVKLLRYRVEIEEMAVTIELEKFTKINVKINPESVWVEVDDLEEDSTLITRQTNCLIQPMEKTDKKSIDGIVEEVHRNRVLVNFDRAKSVDTSKLYRIQFLPNLLSFTQEHSAINKIKNEELVTFFFPQKSQSQTSIPIDYEFQWVNKGVGANEMQSIACKNIVNQTSYPAPYIIFGPPGTGKTATIVETICQILLLKPKNKILVTASSNAACNEIALRLLKSPTIMSKDIHRLFAASVESKSEQIDEDLNDASNLKYGFHYYPALDILYEYKVVIATLGVCGRLVQANIKRDHFQYVFIDESCTEIESKTLVAIAGLISSQKKINGTIVLAGDPHQLGPILKSDYLKRIGGEMSMMERLMETPLYKRDGSYNATVITKLLKNYRTHPSLLGFSNKSFYNNELVAQIIPGVNDWALKSKILALPKKNFPIFCHNVDGKCQQESNSKSFFNSAEINIAVSYCLNLLQNGINKRKIVGTDIGIISPYKKQCTRLKDALRKQGLPDIEVGSVEIFQGREKPIIILTTVRVGKIGFLNNPKRLNVAVTRAKSLLILVCDVNTLIKDPLWKDLIAYCLQNNSIIRMGPPKLAKLKRTLGIAQIQTVSSRKGNYKMNNGSSCKIEDKLKRLQVSCNESVNVKQNNDKIKIKAENVTQVYRTIVTKAAFDGETVRPTLQTMEKKNEASKLDAGATQSAETSYIYYNTNQIPVESAVQYSLLNYYNYPEVPACTGSELIEEQFKIYSRLNNCYESVSNLPQNRQKTHKTCCLL